MFFHVGFLSVARRSRATTLAIDTIHHSLILNQPLLFVNEGREKYNYELTDRPF